MSRTESSRRWLQRQKKDPYVQQAKQAGLRSRAAFKLIEIQEKYKIIQTRMRVLELGCAPGSWTELLNNWVGRDGSVVAVDLLPINPIPGVIFRQENIETDQFWHWCAAQSEDGFDAVLSDMAPNMSGNQTTDQLRTERMVEHVIEVARVNAKKGSVLLVKVFHGGGFNDILKQLRFDYKQVKVMKPNASRRESGEVYLLAIGKIQGKLNDEESER